jgi:hypothetical protein
VLPENKVVESVKVGEKGDVANMKSGPESGKSTPESCDSPKQNTVVSFSLRKAANKVDRFVVSNIMRTCDVYSFPTSSERALIVRILVCPFVCNIANSITDLF